MPIGPGAAITGGAFGMLQAVANEMKEAKARKDYRHARDRAGDVTQALEGDPALGAARTSILGSLNQPQGIDLGTQRQMMSMLRSNVGGQQAGQVRGLNEDLARRGLLGGSTDLSNRQAISRQALSSLAGGQQALQIESAQERARNEQMARNQALSLVGTRQGNFGAGAQSLSAQTGGLAALLGKFQKPGDIGQAAQGGAALFNSLQGFGGTP